MKFRSFLTSEAIRPEDSDYAQRYFSSAPSSMRQMMIDVIQRAVPKGIIAHFISPDGFSEQDKAKLSAYRVLGDELGFDIGPWQFKPQSGTAVATIRPK